MSDFYSLAIAEMVEAAGYVCHIGFSEAGTEAQRVHPIGWLQIEYSLDRYDAGQMPALDSERKT
ncbi:hypothetical protein [Nostoc sp. ATCC 53789]|uniref:hypothetical protein n=1 Tax=Nostoc sp. ATCC 53789 TaxID=76335 RepID=UPI001C68DE4E|nr:hypothetical protein [Nostoc sp. ATCC 53789]